MFNIIYKDKLQLQDRYKISHSLLAHLSDSLTWWRQVASVFILVSCLVSQ